MAAKKTEAKKAGATSAAMSKSQLINAIYQLIGILAMMLWISWSLALLSATVLPLGVVATLAILRRSRSSCCFQG